MSAAETNTSICNIALVRAGATEIVDLETGSDKEAVICRRLFHPARRAALVLHHWNGAKRSVQLSQNADVTPVFYSYAFDLPEDFLRLISAHPSNDLTTACPYSLENANDVDADNVLMADSTTIYIRYIFDNTDVATLSQGFRDMFAFVLARDICGALQHSLSKHELTDKDFRRALNLAKSVDGMQDYPERLDEGSWMRSRFGPYGDRRNFTVE